MQNNKTCNQTFVPFPLGPGDFHEGDWCLVKYDEKYYPGIIEQHRNANYLVSVMVSTANRNLWKWPNPPDCVWYTRQNVVTKLQPPEPVSSRGVYRFKNMIFDKEL